MLLGLALFLSACSSPLNSDVQNLGRAFSLPVLSGESGPELRLWTMGGESGIVTGYVVRSDQIAIYQTLAPVKVVETHAAESLISLIPRLRRVRAQNCELVMDGGSVAVEGVDNDGYFSYRIDSFETCEGWNLHVLDQALRTAIGVSEQSS